MPVTSFHVSKFHMNYPNSLDYKQLSLNLNIDKDGGYLITDFNKHIEI
jgi:hypothetical protein